MIALLASALLGLYVFIPAIVFRRITSWFTPLKKFQRTKTEELISGVLVAAIPICAAWILSLTVWFVGHHPFRLDPGREPRTGDYRTLILAANSESYFKENEAKVWTAAAHIEKRQLRFLTWTYLMLLIESASWSILTYNYATFRRFKPYDWFATKILLKRVSEWHVLLSTYNFPKKEKRFVLIDVLCDGTLYQGQLAEAFLDKDGDLSGILLKAATRYRYAEHEADREDGKLKPSDNYWSKIESGNLYIPYSKISNMNIHYQLPKEAELKRVEEDAIVLDVLKLIRAQTGKSKIKIETRG